MQASSSRGGGRYKFDMRRTAIEGQEHSRYTLIRQQQQQSTPSPPPPALTAATVSAASASQPEALAQVLTV